MGLTQSQMGRRREQQGTSDTVHRPSYTTSPDPEKADQYSMPAHWNFTFGWAPKFLRRILHFALKVLCLASLGHSELQTIWDVCCADERTWFEATWRLSDRLNTIVVVAGLLLSSTAAFLTTAPPILQDFDYNRRAVYVCLLLSFATPLGTLIVGSAIMFVVSKCSAEWFIRTHMGSRSRILCTMYLIAYPFLSMAVSGSMLAIALLLTAWTSQNELVAKGAVWLVLFPLTCLPIWTWTQLGGPAEPASAAQLAAGQKEATGEAGQSQRLEPVHRGTQATLPVTTYDYVA